MWPRIVLWSWIGPGRAFAAISRNRLAGQVLPLMLLRWSAAPITTVLNLYYHPAPALLPIPFDIPLQTYRFYEIFWYGPYGLLMVFAIAWVLFVLCRRFSPRDPRISFRRVAGITSLAFFTPWLVLLVVEPLIASGYGTPRFLVPAHLAILGWEALLAGIGLRTAFNLSRRQVLILGCTMGIVFVVLGAPVIR